MKKIGLLVLAGLLLLTACGGGTSTSSPSGSTPLESVPGDYAGKTNPLGADAAAQGTEVFKTNCVMCHGEGGKGDGIAGQSLDPKPANLVDLS